MIESVHTHTHLPEVAFFVHIKCLQYDCKQSHRRFHHTELQSRLQIMRRLMHVQAHKTVHTFVHTHTCTITCAFLYVLYCMYTCVYTQKEKLTCLQKRRNLIEQVMDGKQHVPAHQLRLYIHHINQYMYIMIHYPNTQQITYAVRATHSRGCPLIELSTAVSPPR